MDVMYLGEPTSDYVESALNTVLDIHLRVTIRNDRINVKEPEGDILLFLTGRDEIERSVVEIGERMGALPASTQKLNALPLYAGLPTSEQMAVFQPSRDDERKVVIATNVAEASVTIDGIVYVIDCGFVKVPPLLTSLMKMRAFNPKTGIESLLVAPTSQASALQRTGRAGRTKPGKCYRLYTKAAYDSLSPTSVPEIQRADFAPIVLALKSLGIDNVLRFEYLSPPPAESMVRALEVLYSLQALDEYGRLATPLGQRMAEIPLAPSMAKILLDSQRWGCTEEVLTIAAMCSVQGIWVQAEGEKRMESERRKFTVEEGDHLTLLNGTLV